MLVTVRIEKEMSGVGTLDVNEWALLIESCANLIVPGN